MTEIAKAYEPHSVEQRWYPFWDEKGYFKPHGDGPIYCITIPPPNVTGSLHMGHALGCTIEDIFTRWRRMAAYNAMWLPGMDHAGIATQTVVERELRGMEKKSRHDIGREAFIQRVWEWRARTGDRILELAGSPTRRSMGDRGKARILADFTFARQAREYEELFGQLCAPRDVPHAVGIP